MSGSRARGRDPIRALGGGLLCVVGAMVLSGCAMTPPYKYEYKRGKTAILRPDGIAIPPKKAPGRVRAAIHAGNRISGLPYVYGGGHRSFHDRGYDCSGAASYLLHAAGKLRSPMPSSGFRRYGKRGKGKWITVYAKKGHVFTVVAGLRYDTGWNGGRKGPRWSKGSRPAKGYVMRHPPGL